MLWYVPAAASLSSVMARAISISSVNFSRPSRAGVVGFASLRCMLGVKG